MPETGPDVPDDVRAYIETRLREVAAEEGVRVLFAIESGSRAWGFSSPDSDYDVRFIYQHPRDWYVSLSEGRDVIERGVDARDIDLAGWDLRKALRLLLKWNPVLHEWLVSPITYAQDEAFRSDLSEFYGRYANLRAIGHHYDSLLRSQLKRNLRSDRVKLKAYFYVIRPLLSLRWLGDTHTMPPMHLEALIDGGQLPYDVRTAIDGLLVLKRTTPELGKGPRIPVIDRWIENALEDVDPTSLPRPDTADEARAAADALFRRMIQQKPPIAPPE